MVVSPSVNSVTADKPMVTEEIVVTNPPVMAVEAPINDNDDEVVSIESFYTGAEEAYQNQNWQKAIADFEQVSSLDEAFQSDKVKTYLADAYFNAGKENVTNLSGEERNIDTALTQFRKAISLSPENAEIQEATELLTTYSVGLRALRLGSFQQAIDILLPLYEKSPDYLAEQIGQQLYKTYLEIGDRAMRKRNTQVAIDFFNRAKAIAVADSSEVDARMASLEKVKVAQATPTPTPTPIVTVTVTPTLTIAPQAVVVAETTPAPTTEPANCPDPRAVLIAPENGSVLQGFVPIFGTAINEEFWYYKLEFASELSSEFKFIFREDFPVPNGRLAYWNTTLVPNGVYKLRLVVVEPTGNFPEPCEVTIQIKNAEQS